ncbi:MAG: DUF2087 domain-containing protein [Betaproteobacteria bacterium]
MNLIERFRRLAVKRGLTPGALLDASPADFDLLMMVLRREFAEARNYSEREVNDLLGHWLQSSGGMLDVDHVELRRWLVDLTLLTRDAYGHAYALAPVPVRLANLAAEAAGVDFGHEYADANAHESQKRAARKAAWQQVKPASSTR